MKVLQVSLALVILSIALQIARGYNYISLHPAILCAFIGLILALIRRHLALKARKDNRTIGILLNDYRFEQYATINMLSLIYSIAQGILLGAGAGYLIDWIGIAVSYPGNITSYYPLGIALICLSSLFVTRIFLESYSLVYRAIQDWIKSMNHD